MKPRQQLIDEGILNESKITSRHSIAIFYQKQLKKFADIGMGNQTEHGITVTPDLIKITRDRLKQLRPFIRTTEKGDE